MDGQHFDTLVRALVEGRLTRRSAWWLLGGGALVSTALTRLADATAPAKSAGRDRRQGDQVRRFKCLASGRLCSHNPKKPKSSRSCKRCCTTSISVDPGNPIKGKCCSPNGHSCLSDAQCCLGECSVGVCQNTTFQPPFPPAPPRGLLTPCNTVVDCGVQVGDVCPNVPDQCALIQPQKGPRTCGTPGSGGIAVCCRPNCGSCSDDCECCQDLRCRNGTCGPPPACHHRGEACTDGEPCCAGAGSCNGTICCLADGASCPCGEPGYCQGCCSGLCGVDGRCGSGSPPPPPPTCRLYSETCGAGLSPCCNNVPCVGGTCRFN